VAPAPRGSEVSAAASPGAAFAPARVAELVRELGVAKARLPFVQTATLGLLAGAFISFGALFFAVTVTGSTLGFGPTRLLGGIAFSLGLILVVIAGAELFTGNNLIVMAWAERRIGLSDLLRNWAIVYCANFAGALGTAILVLLAGTLELGRGELKATLFSIAAAKLALTPLEAFARGILCNALVCLAVWLCVAARSVADKILAILFPIAAFVALGFEHSVANMFLLPLAAGAGAAGAGIGPILGNLVSVTAGNIIGGSLFVALVYWICYLRESRAGAG
jgi:formate transporter